MKVDNISRRKFLKLSGLTGVALTLGYYLPADAKEAELITAIDAENRGIELNSWIYIDVSGKVTLYSHRAEMGQGVYQSIPQIIAEELHVDLDKVNIVFAPGDNVKYGNQITGGSSSIRGSYKNLLNLSATARVMLIKAASNKWGALESDCYAEDGSVFHKLSGKKLHYGELVLDASKLNIPKNVILKKTSEYKLIRKPLQRQDTPLKINGTAVFGIDKVIPGMLYAMVERNPRLRGKVKSFDDSETRKIPGVKQVFVVRMGVFNTFREGVAVVADSVWAAMKGKKALKVDWDDTGFEHLSTDDIYRRMDEALQKEEGLSFLSQGDPNSIIQSAEKKIDVVYTTPYQSHSCMEPLNCIAHYQKDKVEIWGPIQAPEWVQDYISKELGIAREKVIVNMTFLGGGFGRKAFMDYPHEATMISKEIGAPVQVIWSREDDVTQGPYRPGVSYRCQGVVSDNEISAFKVSIAGQNNNHWRGGAKDVANRSSTEGFLKPYLDNIKNLSIVDIPFETPIPTMWWRSVYASTNGFAYESFMDELAVESGKDPIAFRRTYLKDERSRNLLDKLEEVSGWKNKSKGYGVAITECFGSTVGQIVKVSKNIENQLQIDQVWAVIDCGWYVNPDIIKAQVEGSIVMALGAATIHEITFKEGKTVQNNFNNYKMPRISDIPPIEVHIMENDSDAGGVGEPGLPPFAPALTNAIFDLTGKRIRKLPFELTKV
ncbi:molybdopterin cofactor-binding domain-containing protein [Flavobacterium gawalongense]|uniref:Xanthine dehydrogenase family protein molybdopterin-binding subunit n=1 Tax=Flavobacterium gawalongense TaxID=2594432 RepID=A0A553BHA9_9FLAO|nr:molybdopterin cofactor-binding domain-containing protein [Flavobacterium gawalongense]TRX03356.1 xanthine dehydrogenase family protein molybdopterin-binding subunit [Flavobacterium gawalongense]TRX04041.1 xanthine dehydrogenase family protein molybdopterin-binding subunit [Flavobacterium gawalongense]TRX07641.1 xanthine dehydrogenase family protein molybdopterin-binding subunit [Flavobacterium gawalongense]TRX07846.1 xanthine dehydrogenase family protein molybdopterin-binding subunit [Flavob